VNFTAERMKGIHKSLIRQIHDAAPQGAINLGLGEIQFAFPKRLAEEAKRIIDEESIVYTPNAGLLSSRQAIAMYHGPQFDPNGVCITNGAEEALFCTLTACIDPEDQVAIVDPAYSAYETIVRMAEGRPLRVPLLSTTFQTDREALSALAVLQCKVLILCHPSNPTSVAFSFEDMQWIVDFCFEHGIFLIVDEIYRELYLNNPIRSFAECMNNQHLIIISGLSKSHCATGWRLGWVIGSTDLIQQIIIVHQYVSTCAGFVAQRLLPLALSKVGMESVTKLRSELQVNYHFITKELRKSIPQWSIPESHAAPYLFVKVEGDDLELAKQLAQSGVITVPGQAFGKIGMGYLRISYALPKDLLREGINRLTCYIQQHS